MEIIKTNFKREGVTMQTNMEEFAVALKTWRLRAGLTQQQLGDRWGTSRYTILRAEGARAITWESAYKLFAKLSYELEQEGRNHGNSNT